MTEDEFVDLHCAQQGITRAELRRVAVPCSCGAAQCPGWMMIPGPSMLGGAHWTLPNGLSSEEMRQYMLDCAAGKIPPDVERKEDEAI